MQGHGHGHHHHDDHGGGHHHHHHPAPSRLTTAFAAGIALNLLYVGGEAVGGVLAHSVALFADAGHNLGDVLGLCGAWLASILARRRPSRRYTYGLRGSSMLAALGNAMLLLVVTGGIAWEALRRLAHPEPSAGGLMMAVAAIGILVNGGTALLFASGREHDLNLRATFAHMAADALVAAGVVASGALILWTGWLWIDPAISLIVSAVIVAGTWSLLRESLDLAMHAVPPGVDEERVADFLRGLPGVTAIHDLHIWGMSTTETALTAHLVRPDAALDDDMLRVACHELSVRFGIGHATLQIENGLGAEPCHLESDEVV